MPKISITPRSLQVSCHRHSSFTRFFSFVIGVSDYLRECFSHHVAMVRLFRTLQFCNTLNHMHAAKIVPYQFFNNFRNWPNWRIDIKLKMLWVGNNCWSWESNLKHNPGKLCQFINALLTLFYGWLRQAACKTLNKDLPFLVQFLGTKISLNFTA